MLRIPFRRRSVTTIEPCNRISLYTVEFTKAKVNIFASFNAGQSERQMEGRMRKEGHVYYLSHLGGAENECQGTAEK